MTLLLDELQAKLPLGWPESLLSEIRDRLVPSGVTLVVLDDDPTGTQTVYDLPVLTEWSVPTLRGQFSLDDPVFYILTNSRSLPEAEAIAMMREIGENLLTAACETGREFDVVSRSDSTLRGHYPAEVDALAEVLGYTDAVQVIAPFFLEGGRLTVDDVHYVVEEKRLIEAAETPFAKDAAFGFCHSNLRDWVEEKSQGRIPSDQVASITLNDLRNRGPTEVAAKLQALPPASVCVVNAVTLRDMEVFALASLLAAEQGQQLLFRTAASFVQARAGLATRPLLAAESIVDDSAAAGLIVAGSYVPKTTAQLHHLQELYGNQLTAVELSVAKLLDPNTKTQAIADASRAVNSSLQAGRDALLFTSRELMQSDTGDQNLEVGKLVSSALVEIVESIDVKLRFLIAKGGITSSDVATRALNVRRAMVLGQILPGVPVWRLGDESRRPGLGYVIFPGNVGDEAALAKAYDKLRPSN